MLSQTPRFNAGCFFSHWMPRTAKGVLASGLQDLYFCFEAGFIGGLCGAENRNGQTFEGPVQ
jgi:hypothetical protein